VPTDGPPHASPAQAGEQFIQRRADAAALPHVQRRQFDAQLLAVGSVELVATLFNQRRAARGQAPDDLSCALRPRAAIA
jgi:hypothetical protein